MKRKDNRTRCGFDIATRLATSIAGVAAIVVSSCIAWGQTASTGSGQGYPVKPLHIVTAEPGGGNDFVSRIVAQALAAGVGQQVIVENRGGASGALAAQTVSRAPADGHTLLLYSSSLWIMPLLQPDATWDAFRDFAPIALVASSPNVLVVHPALPVRTVAQLIALARVRPGELNYAAGSNGSTPHLAAELFKSMAGVNIVRIAYRSNASSFTDLIAGQVHMVFATTGSAAPHLRAGRLRALAVTSAQPSVLMPGLPTVAAAGLPGYESVSRYGMFVPVKTPPPFIDRLQQEMTRVLGSADVKQKFLGAGVEAGGGSAEQFTATMKADIMRMGKVIREAGIHAD